MNGQWKDGNVTLFALGTSPTAHFEIQVLHYGDQLIADSHLSFSNSHSSPGHFYNPKLDPSLKILNYLYIYDPWSVIENIEVNN